jgi:membrane protease subunit HflK
VQRTEVGSIDAPGRPGQRDQRPDEALMLTGDENIVDINISAFWTVSDARAFLFNIRDPDLTVKSATESAVREVVGRMPIASVLAEGRHQVETDTQALLQQILDTYGAGILVGQVQLQKADPPAQVIEAFRDVQRAHTDADSLRNKAEAYANDVVPRARGEAAQISQEAEGYKTAMVAQATGNAERFSEVYKAYRLAKDVTAERMYLETVEEVLKGANKVLVDHATAGVLPWLALPNGSGSDGNPPPLPGAAKGAK